MEGTHAPLRHLQSASGFKFAAAGPLLPFLRGGWHCSFSQGSCGWRILVSSEREGVCDVCVCVCCSENRFSISHYVIST